MKVIKPLKLGLIHRTYGHLQTHHFAVKAILFFNLKNSTEIVSEAQGWQRLMSVLPQRQVFDEGIPKASPEVLLYGDACSPEGEQTQKLLTRLELGSMVKPLQVTGNRIWQKRGFFFRKASPAAPFSRMPLTWEGAFGGQMDERNPVGQGALSIGEMGETLIGLPNVAYPDDELTSPKKSIEPAGYGPLDALWAPRTASNALFDQKYMDTTHPALPDAMDFARFNMAPKDQWLQALQGDETYRLVNLHPQDPLIEGRLPPYRPRVFTQAGSDFQEMTMAPETVWFLPSADLGAVLYCGQMPVRRRFAQLALSELMLAYEAVVDEPRDLDYYRHVLQLRVDPNTSYQYVTDEAQLSPQKSPTQLEAQRQEHAEYVATLNARREQQWRSNKSEIEAKHGVVVPDDHQPSQVDPRSVVSPAAIKRRDYSLASVAEYAQERKEAGRMQLVQAKENAAKAKKANPDGKSVSEEEVLAEAMSRTRDGRLDSKPEPEVPGAGAQSLPTRSDVYRMWLKGRAKSTQPAPISFRKASEAGAALRDVVVQRQQQGQSLAFRDYTGADLAGLDFSNADLQGSVFECANLTACSFAGANLDNTSFLAASLDATNFTGASLVGANFSRARGDAGLWVGADLSKGVLFHDTHLTNPDFAGANLNTASATNAKFICANFSGASLSRSTITRSIFDGSVFNKASIDTTTFLETSLQRSQWHEATLERSVILNSQMQMADIKNSRWQRCQIAGNSWLTAATIEGCTFSNCGLRSASGTGVSFSGSAFQGSDMAMSHFPAVKFRGATTSDCLANDNTFSDGDFTDAALTATSFADTDFSRSDLSNASFYQSDVLLAHFDDANYVDAKEIMPTKIQRLANERG
jgi:uncharacterized protein YjbI with pentapeptide repeats